MKSNSPFLMRTPLCVLVLALLVTGLVTHYVALTAEGRDQQRFDEATRATESAIRERLDACVALLVGTRGYILSAGSVRRRGFREYIASLDLPRRYPGIQGIGVSVRLRSGEVSRFIASLRAREEMPDFHI
jgi:CHASE1-domain containing sensor protein